jgi:hypothetical protein
VTLGGGIELTLLGKSREAPTFPSVIDQADHGRAEL